jgi:hypothetical protein
MPEGKSWLSFALPEEERSSSLDSLVFPFPFIDPAQLLATFEEVGGVPKGLGEQDVRGVPTEGYRLELDLAKLVDAAQRVAVLRRRGELERRERKTMPVEVWIDDADRARRVVVAIDGSEATVDFFDFGLRVDVEAPPAAEVLDAADAFAGAEGGIETDSGTGEGEGAAEGEGE